MIIKVYLLLYEYQCAFLNIKALNQNIIILYFNQIKLKQQKSGPSGLFFVFSFNKVPAAYVGIFGDVHLGFLHICKH